MIGKQINFYLNQTDIEKIEKYLKDRNFVFVLDNILSAPNPVYLDRLFSPLGYARYITFANQKMDFMSWKEEDQQKFRVKGIDSRMIEFNIFGKSEEHYRARFYYQPYENKDPEFEKFVDRFFRWFRKNYKAVPESPFFFQNPEEPVKELF